MTIWDVLPHPSTDHVVRLFAKKKGENRGDFARSKSELERFINSCPEWNIYLGPNPTKARTGVRHSASDVTHWSFLLFDMDPVEVGADPIKAMYELLKMFGGLCGHNLVDYPEKQPTLIDSGRGVQAWFRGEDLEFTEDSITRKEVRKIMSFWLRRLATRLGTIHGCRLDTSVSDLPRVMRVPQTINTKTGQMATIIHCQEYPFPWLFPFLIAGCPAEVLIEQDVTEYPGAPWQLIWARLTPSSKDYIKKGLEEPGRHKVAWHTAKTFYDHGIARPEARKALNLANSRLPEQALSDQEIEHILNTAYRE